MKIITVNTVIVLLILFGLLCIWIDYYHKCDMSSNLVHLLIYTVSILKKEHVDYWLDYGTLLGARREGRIIPFEFDIDLSIPESECDRLLAQRELFAADHYYMFGRNEWISEKHNLILGFDGYLHDPCVRIYDRYMKYFLDIYWYRRVPAKQVLLYNPPLFHNIVNYTSDQGDIWCNLPGFDGSEQGACKLNSAIFPLKTMTFHGITVNIPNDPDACLRWLYGPNWHIPNPSGYKKAICLWFPSRRKLYFGLFLCTIILNFLIKRISLI